MKIAFFTDTFLPQVNGVATSIANFAGELSREGHEVLIVCPRPKGMRRTWSHPNVTVVDLPSVPILLYPDFRVSPFMGLPKGLAAVKKFNPDVIHFHTTLSTSIDAVAAAKIFDKPLIGTNHTYLTWKENEYLSFVAKNPVVRNYITKAAMAYSLAFFDLCDVQIAPSKMLIDALKREGYKKEILCLPNAVPTEENNILSPDAVAAAKKKYGLKEKVVLHYGRLSAEKNTADVLRAFALVHKQNPNTSLLLIGDGPERKELEREVEELGIGSSTVFTGFIENTELMKSGLISIADVFTTASAMESQGLVLVEAMSFRVPIVAVGECAIPEVVGDAGLLTKKGDVQEMADRILDLLRDHDLNERMRQKAQVRSKDFSLEASTKKLLRIYEDAMKIQKDNG